MRKMKNFIGILSVLALFLGLGCKSQQQDENTSEIIDISNYTKTDSLLSIRSLLEDVSYIKLKGADKFYLSDTKKILHIYGKITLH